jgi:hypothetical protein
MVEGERDAPAAEAAEEVPKEMNFQEAIQERGGEGEGRERVVRPRHQRRRAEKQLSHRLPVAGGLGLHRSPIEELDLAGVDGRDRDGGETREGGE